MAKYKLGEICEIVGGSTPKSDVAEYWDGDIKWITPAELNEDSYILTDSVRKITALGVQKAGLSPFPKDTVILSSRAPIGKVAIAGCEMYCNQGFKNLICSSVIDCHYLYWFLKGKTEYLNSLGRGATFKEISKQIVAGIEIEVPPIEKQQDIARRFEETKRLISILKQQIQVLDQLIKARFVEMFEESDYPQMTLYDVIEPGAGLSYGIIVPGEYFKDGCPMVRPSDYQNGKLNLQNVYRVNPEIEARYKKTRLQGNEILVQVIGQPGQIIPATEECKGMNVTRNLAVIRPNSMIINREYLVEYMRTETAQQYMTGSTKQSTLKQLPLSLLKTIVIPIPPIEKQLEFASFVFQVDKSKVVVQKALDEAKLLFDSLMQKYFG